LIECVRGDAGRGVLIGLSTSQFLGVATALLAIAAAVVLRRRDTAAMDS